MNQAWRVSSLLWILTVSTALSQTSPAKAVPSPASESWPQFRGNQAAGIGPGNPVTTWNVETNENVLWKRDTVGLAHSCPIVFGNRLFLTTAQSKTPQPSEIPTGFLGGTGDPVEETGGWRWQVACLDLETGAEIWRRTVAEGVPQIKRHLKATHANSTPATDGQHVVAFFGSEGLYCLDVEGNLLWSKQFGKLHSGPYNAPELEWGFASSPVIHDGLVIVQCDCLNASFVSILDLKTGEDLRRIDRKDVATWSTPLVVPTKTETQLVCNGYRQMAGYDLASGKQLWTISGGGDVPVPAPLFAHGLIYLFNGHGRSAAYAVSPTARGDLTPENETPNEQGDLPDGLQWWDPTAGSYIPTPIIVGDFLYTNTRGILTARDARTGKKLFSKRMGEQYSASPVATSNQIYLCGEGGTVSVVKVGPEFDLIAEVEMGESIFATPAICGDKLIIRTVKSLYCIGSRPIQTKD